MKIFGFQIGKAPVATKTEAIQDQIPEITNIVPDTKKPALIPFVKNPVLNYHSSRGRGRGAFQSAEYNLAEIGRIEDTDSYVRQAFTKKVGLLLKEGWDIVGPNPRTVKYVKSRLAQIARASNKPTEMLIRSIAEGMIKKSNTFLLKVRKTEASGGKVRSESGSTKPLEPVAAYFVIPSETVEFSLSGNKIVKWRQSMPDGSYKEYLPRDIVHFFYDQKEGFIFGTPTITPVIDDIRALRKIEENLELLIYQHLFPLFHYKVGTEESPAGITESGEREIDVVRREIMYMPTEGGIVTPERHEIKAIGAEGRALRAEGYVDHFKKRVFSGLGVSAVDMGEGETANRACYSEDTETLTDSGWKFYWQITKEDKIATFNPETQELEFHYPNGDILLYDYEGKMIAFRNRNIDMLVTPDHDMWVGQPTFSGDLNWEKIHADSIPQYQFKFRTGNLGWTGIDPENFELPYVPYDCYSEVPNSGPFQRIDIYDWLEFLGYYASEGCLAKSKGKWAVTLSQNERVNPIKTERIRVLLDKLPFKYNEYTDPKDQTVRFWINCKSLYLYLQENCGDYSYQKRLPHEVLNYDRDYLDTLFDALMLGDGTVDKREGRTSRTYYSNSELLLNQVQEIALKLGYRAHILPGSRCGRVCVSENTVSNIVKDFVKEVDYRGKVYCFNVPNHLFVTRRNGRIGIHGNTADNMSRNMVDGVKDFQRVIEIIFKHEIIDELLLESTFGLDVLDDENKVELKFQEIDIDAQIKKQTHYADQFNKDIITHDETRIAIGLEPISMPDPKESQAGTVDLTKYPAWMKTRWKMFEEPKLLIQSIDEPYSPHAQAVAENNSTEINKPGLDEAGKKQNEQEINLEKEKTKAKIAVAKAKPKPTAQKKDAYINTTYNTIKHDTVFRIGNEQNVDMEWIGQLIRAQMGTAITQLQSQQILQFKNEYTKHNPNTAQLINSMGIVRAQLQDRADHYITRLTEHVISALKKHVQQDDSLQERQRKARAVFDSLEFRTKFIEDVEISKAKNLGFILAAKDLGASILRFLPQGNEPCAICVERSKTTIPADIAHLHDFPPHHSGCMCLIDVIHHSPETNLISPVANTQDSVIISDNDPSLKDADIDEPDEDLHEKGDYVKCPKCGNTAIQNKSTGIYRCNKCNHTFQRIEDDQEVEDGASLEECVKSVKTSLRKQHPDWDADKIKSSAFAICKSKGKK